ncbi:MAG: DUF3363 domain-containing protein [Pseudomonadota bacterium]|nr:DUF3363 domain-containing protein [Pseudomonadota bacterium]
MARNDDDVALKIRPRRMRKETPPKAPKVKLKGYRRGFTSIIKTRPERMQRVMIKVNYTHNGASGAWGAHGRYLAREGANREDERGLGFNAERDDVDLKRTMDEWQNSGDELMFRIIVSPEFGGEMDLRAHTRKLVAQIEKDVGSRLHWAAIDHYNTAHPHVHLSIRGVDADGDPLRFRKEYITRGIRQRAMEIATQSLGWRTIEDIDRARTLSIEAPRFTDLDRRLIERAIDYQVEFANTREAHKEEGELRKRLTVLSDMGLAKEINARAWGIDPDLEKRLRTIQLQRDIVRSQARELGEERRRRLGWTVVDDIEHGPTRKL